MSADFETAPIGTLDRLRRAEETAADTDGAITILGFQNAELRKRVSELQSKLLIAAAALATIRKSPEACAHINVPMLDAAISGIDAAMAKGGDLSNADAERCAAAVIDAVFET